MNGKPNFDAVVEDAIDHARPLELPPRNNRRYHCFVDASADRHDAFSCAIVRGTRAKRLGCVMSSAAG